MQLVLHMISKTFFTLRKVILRGGKMVQSKFDKKKFAIALKPINMTIIDYLQKNATATTKDLIEHTKDYAQASVYRAVKELLDADIIAIQKEKKVHSVMERYFTLNYDTSESLNDYTAQDRYHDIVNAVNIFMGTVTKEIHDYLAEWMQTKDAIRFGMGRELMHISDKNFEAFYRELDQLIKKYQAIAPTGDEKTLAFSASWVPIKKG